MRVLSGQRLTKMQQTFERNRTYLANCVNLQGSIPTEISFEDCSYAYKKKGTIIVFGTSNTPFDLVLRLFSTLRFISSLVKILPIQDSDSS